MFRDFRVPAANLLQADARRRADDRLSRAEPGPHCAVRQCRRRDAADDGQHDSLGQVPQNLRRADRQPRAGAAPAGPAGRADRRPATRWSQWCAGLIDQGYRGEMECIVAKIFGSEAQKEAAIELFMKTHGGRSFLHGHMFGDNVHEYLAPCIYEGEGEMLAMAFFKSLVKQHGMQFFEPIGKALQAAGIKQAEPGESGPRLGTAKGPSCRMPNGWSARSCAAKPLPQLAADAARLCETHAEFAADQLAALAARDQRHDEQASIGSGRPAVPHVGIVAARARPGDHALHQPVRRAASRTRSFAQAADVLLPGPDSQAHRQATLGPLLPHGHQAGRSDRRRRISNRSPACTRMRF